ncbi:MAG: ABC-type transporter Mla subunit MlaD [Maribacter sp.]|jgi:ABC-type transporter Mla subunit MlaD
MSKENKDPNQKQYSKLGIIIAVIFIILVIALNFGKDNVPGKFYSIYIEMPQIGNLKEGSAVFNQGSQIGYIKSIEMTNKKFILHSKLKQKTRLPAAASGQIVQDDYKKQDFLEITVSDWGSPLLEEGDTIDF